MNWLLVVVMIILIGNAFIGRKVGFIKIVFSLVSLILALFLTSWISPHVNNVLRNNEKFYNSITQQVENVLQLKSERVIEENQAAAIGELPLPDSIKETLIKNNNKEVYGALAIQSFQEYVSTYLANIIINALAFFITFIVILIALWIISNVLNIVSKLPVLNQINKTAGFAAGLVHGLIVVWVLFILITVFGGMEFGQRAFQMIEGNRLLSYIYDNNLLLGFITKATEVLF